MKKYRIVQFGPSNFRIERLSRNGVWNPTNDPTWASMEDASARLDRIIANIELKPVVVREVEIE